jgi:hypothetical protein
MLNDITCIAKCAIKSVVNVHRPGSRKNIFLFSTPRSGSTWLMELIWSQSDFKACNEPLDLRNPLVRRYLGITEWLELYNHSALPALQRYFQALCEGRLHAIDPVPFRGYCRPVTHRIVFKIINGAEDRINWFRDTFNGQIVYLIRHPIAVGLSREYYPRLQALLNSDYRRHFTQDQLDFAQRVLENGTKLEHGVLAWCLENAVPLWTATADWLMITYEELVLDPQPVIAQLAERLALPEPERMLSRLAVPSAVKAKSNQETQRALERGTDRRWLVEKWRGHVSESEESRAMEILAHFQLDIYQRGELLPCWRSVTKRPDPSHSFQPAGTLSEAHGSAVGEMR